MGKSITIGNREYGSKKEAIAHYRAILNAYSFGQSLTDADFYDVISLLSYSLGAPSENEAPEQENEIFIEDIKVSKVQYKTKCFEVFYSDNTSSYISYLLLINKQTYSAERLFYAACRNAVRKDIHAVKARYFKNAVNRQVKCQETGVMSTWEELVVDHRQPNTFSIIIDRFKEVYNIDIESIEYTSDGNNHIVFVDGLLAEQFKKYHNGKANLRVVRRECNAKRTALSRVKRTKKDLPI
jgi:hypothetical protein